MKKKIQDMTIASLKKLISRGEDSTHQFKKDITNPDALASELVAFSNSQGGTIFIGVSDNGEMIGLAPHDVARLNQLISNTASQHVRSPISPHTENVQIGKGKIVIVVTVPEGIDKPYFDRNGVIWQKNGADKRRISSKEELRRIFQSVDTFYADEVPTKAAIAEVDREKFKRFFEKTYESPTPSTRSALAALLKNLELARDNMLNLAGLLLFGTNPQRFKPVFMVKAAAFPGTSIAAKEYLDSEDFEGTLDKQFQGALAFIMRNTRKVQGDRNVNSTGIPTVPKIVFEELLVNALIHRDYFINAPVKVLIFSDRIEITSPGTLPNHLTIDTIKMGLSVVRNPILVSFVSKGLLPYRGLGSGIRRVLEETDNIEFVDDREGCTFTARILTGDAGRTLHNGGNEPINRNNEPTKSNNEPKNRKNEPANPDFEPINHDVPPNKELKLKQQILTVLAQKPDSSYDAIAMLLDKGRSTIMRHLQELKDSGAISRRGARKKGSWIVHNEIIDTTKNKETK